jgi:hypothetical protein
MLLPGQELRHFEVLRPKTRENERGQEVISNYEPVGTIRAVLAQAKPEEIERWKQLNHPITHKIIMQRRPPFDIRSGDIFERAGRRFYNQATPYDVGDIGHWTIFYCDERSDADGATHEQTGIGFESP